MNIRTIESGFGPFTKVHWFLLEVDGKAVTACRRHLEGEVIERDSESLTCRGCIRWYLGIRRIK